MASQYAGGQAKRDVRILRTIVTVRSRNVSITTRRRQQPCAADARLGKRTRCPKSNVFPRRAIYRALGKRRLHLFLKLPRLLSETGLVGEMDIQSGLGVHTYTVSQMHHRHIMRVSPQLPLVEVSASEQLREAAAEIRAIASRFKSSGNYFRVSEVGGRLLMTQEPLEWGERYYLLTQQPFVPTPVNFGVEIATEGERRGWYFYEVGLPTFAQSGDDSARADCERYLGRTIRPPRPRVYFVDPPAHHVEADGTHVFPETTEKIIVRRTAGCQVQIEESTTVRDRAQVHDLDDEWCEITGIGIRRLHRLR